MAENFTVLTPLAEALAKLDRVEPVTPSEQDLHAALGLTLAADAGPKPPLRLAGARLRRIDIAVLASFGIQRVSIRAPRVLVLHSLSTQNDALIAGAIEAEGGIATQERSGKSLQEKCNNALADAIIVIGDSDAPDEANLRTLKNVGLEFNGVGLSPGGTIAFGYVNSIPVLLLPGQFDAALAAWLVIGRRLLARLSFRLIEEQPFLLELARPMTSTKGMAEVVPVRRRAAQVEPLSGNAWSPESIARADGWILLPAESDGFPAGSKVAMRPWP